MTMTRSRREPVQITLDKQTLTIEATFRYGASCFNLHPASQIAYADLIEAGIRRKWTTSFEVDERLQRALELFADRRNLPQKRRPDVTKRLQVEVKIYRHPLHGMTYGDTVKPAEKPIHIRLSRTTLLPSRVGSPLWRRVWGFFRVFQIEGLGLNWTRKERGIMTMAPYPSVWQVESVAAHEFGHLMGLGDAYGAIYRFFYEAPGTDDYLMRNNRRLSSEELAMVLDAERKNKMQFFPKSFEKKRFKAGLKREIARIKKQVGDTK